MEKVLGEGMEEKREKRGARTCDQLGEGIEGSGPLRISQLLPVGFFFPLPFVMYKTILFSQ